MRQSAWKQGAQPSGDVKILGRRTVGDDVVSFALPSLKSARICLCASLVENAERLRARDSGVEDSETSNVATLELSCTQRHPRRQ